MAQRYGGQRIHRRHKLSPQTFLERTKMAKTSTRPIELIIATAERWKNNCLIKDGSLFTIGDLWTPQNINQFKRFFSDNLIEGNEETFYQKLKTQLADSPAEVKQLAAEMLYVILLFPRKIKAETKAKDVRLIWSWSGKSLDESFPDLEASFEEGIGSTGMAYNSYRWAELVFFTTWLSSLKSMETLERESLLADPWVFGNWLDKTEGADKRQFRHIVLFLLFPNYYETCSSRKQKNQMLSSFQEKIGNGSPLLSSEDSEWIKKDKNILLIREKLTGAAEEPINFYLPPYREMWMQAVEDKNEVDDLEEESEDGLNTINKFQDLSKMFLDLQAKAKQLDLIDNDQEIPFEFQEKIKEAGKATHEITFEPYSSKLIIKSSQNKLIIPNIAFYMALEALPIYRAIKIFNDAFIAVYERLKSKGQINFSKAEKFYDDVLKSDTPSPLKKIFDDELSIYLKEIGRDSQDNKDLFNKFISDKSWKSAGNGSGKSPGRPDIWNSPVLTAFVTSHSNQGFICEVVGILGGSNQDFSTYSLLNGNADLTTISGPKNLIVYGAPGTGKSYYINNLLKNARSIRTVFHSETQNSDFVGSLKPVTDMNGKVTYEFVAGPFIKSFVEAVKNPNNQIHLIIEEINRANAAAVFGEIFQLLDRDASGRSEYEIQPDDLLSKYLNDKLGSKFNGLIYIPSNLIINATMNSSDQGVYPLDSAFKRRWSFKYMPIDFQGSPKGAVDLDGRRITWDILAKSINEILSTQYAHLEEDRFIGPWFLNKNEVHSQFSKAIESKLFTYLWNDVLRHQQRDKIFNAQDIATFSDLIKVFNRQLAGDQVDVFSELVHQAFDRYIAEATPAVDETVVDETDE